jgi:hypothetical protein
MECNTVWRPKCSKWGSILYFTFGIILSMPFLLVIVFAPNAIFATFSEDEGSGTIIIYFLLFSLGIGGIIYGFKAIKGNFSNDHIFNQQQP